MERASRTTPTTPAIPSSSRTGTGGSFEVRAITPDRAPVPLPPFQVGYTIATPYRFMPTSPEGKQIVFDRLRDNSDIVLMNLAR